MTDKNEFPFDRDITAGLGITDGFLDRLIKSIQTPIADLDTDATYTPPTYLTQREIDHMFELYGNPAPMQALVEPDPVLYILVRSHQSDLPSCNDGKMAAQASHAATAFTYWMNNSEAFVNNDVLQQMYDTWEHPDHGYGVKIVLLATDQDIADAIVSFSQFPDLNVAADWIYDPSYPFLLETEVAKHVDPKNITVIGERENGMTLCTRNERTAAYVFGDKNTIQNTCYLEHLVLHP